jgi:DNA-binding MarR family transcriptional regulator
VSIFQVFIMFASPNRVAEGVMPGLLFDDTTIVPRLLTCQIPAGTMVPMEASPPAAASLAPRDPRLAPWRAFLHAHARLARRLDEDLRSGHGLSLQEYETLLHLAEAPDRRLRMGRLADSLLLSKSGVTRLVDRLVGDGLVERTSCPSDARGAEASLTGAGLAQLRAAAPTHLAGIREHFLSAVQAEDLPVIERAMASISDRLCGAGQAVADPPTGDDRHGQHGH